MNIDLDMFTHFIPLHAELSQYISAPPPSGLQNLVLGPAPLQS